MAHSPISNVIKAEILSGIRRYPNRSKESMCVAYVIRLHKSLSGDSASNSVYFGSSHGEIYYLNYLLKGIYKGFYIYSKTNIFERYLKRKIDHYWRSLEGLKYLIFIFNYFDPSFLQNIT